MVSAVSKPGVGLSLLLIHRILSRGMGVAREKGQIFLVKGFPDEITRQGYRDYVHSLISILQGHHLTEDELAFPQFGIKIPAAPYKLLAADHQKMVVILENIQKSLDRLMDDDGMQALSAILDGLERLTALWYPHIGIEESHFTEQAINQVMPAEEQEVMTGQFSRHSQEHSRPDYLVVPFMLYNLSLPERRIFSATLPPVVTEQLVPQVWKEKWQPMQPFFLME